MRQSSKKSIKKLLSIKTLLSLLAFGLIGFSAWYNILYLTADATGGADYYGAMIGGVLADLMKAAAAFALPLLWAGRRYGMLVLVLSLFAGTTVLSLFSAHQVKRGQQVAQDRIVLKVQQKRARIIKAYTEADKAIAAYKAVGTVGQVKSSLKVAEAAVPAKIWKRTSRCMDATKPDSINICKGVMAQKALLARAQEKAVLSQKLEQATIAVSQLDPLMPETASPALKQAIALIFALVLEIGSSIMLPLAYIDFRQILTVHGRKRSPKASSTTDQPQEVDWIAAMKQAATDEQHAKVVFDKDGLMKAPYGALAKVWGVKSSSTAGQRVQRLKNLGYLEVLGSQKNMRYRMLEAA